MAETYSHSTTQYIPNQIHSDPTYYSNYSMPVAPQPKYPLHTQSLAAAISATTTPEPVRKRPKYTRSKTGCMVCRRKKIKCDEIKPRCERCVRGQRECIWPDPSKGRKSHARKQPLVEERPSTAESSSRLSDSSSTSYDYSDVAISLNSTPLSAARNSPSYDQSYSSTSESVTLRHSYSGKSFPVESNYSYPSIPDYSRYQYTYSSGLSGMYSPECCSHPVAANTTSRLSAATSWAPAQFRAPMNSAATGRSQYIMDRPMPSAYESLRYDNDNRGFPIMHS